MASSSGSAKLNPPPYQIIKPENSRPGKMASDGVQLWGSTLLDFFAVERIPGLYRLRTFSTGSKYLARCKGNGEYEGKRAVGNASHGPSCSGLQCDQESCFCRNLQLKTRNRNEGRYRGSREALRSLPGSFYAPSTSGSSETSLSFCD